MEHLNNISILFFYERFESRIVYHSRIIYYRYIFCWKEEFEGGKPLSPLQKGVYSRDSFLIRPTINYLKYNKVGS